jgi:hypothetical protein
MQENEILGKIERIDQHLRILKDNDEEKTLLLLSIKASLVGSEMNGNKGIVQDIRDTKTDVKELEKTVHEHSIFVKQAKWIVALLISALVGIGFKLLEK